MSDIDELENQTIDFERILNKGDAIRKRILSDSEATPKRVVNNSFSYKINNDDIGLNEISNVDMGYASSSIGLHGDKLSKRNPYLSELEYNVKLMEESKNCIVVLNGDMFTFIPKSRNRELLSYNDQIAYFYSLLKNLAKQGKIVAIVRGKEEHRILKNQRIDVLDILQNALGLRGKVCNDALINMKLTDDIIGEANVGIRTINWNNTATTCAYLGRKMEDRAIKKGGADIYLARSTMNYFKTVVAGKSRHGESVKQPIYLISPGSYTPFKGAMTAGAEYNSIKDNELTPNNFWYKINVEPNPDNSPNARPYIVRVCPINYSAHQIIFQGTDQITDDMMTLLNNQSDKYIEYIISKYPQIIKGTKELGRKQIREILLANKDVVSTNELINEFIRTKHGTLPTSTISSNIVDLKPAPDETPHFIYDNSFEPELI